MTRRDLFLSTLALPAAALAAPKPYFPSASAWDKLTHKEAGADAAAIDEALQYAGDRMSTGVVILRHGRILAEKYWRDWTAETAQPIFSSAKSVTATLIGMAIDDKKLKGIDQPVADFIPAWKGTPKEAILFRHLLTMTSGLAGAMRGQPGPGVDQYIQMIEAGQEAKPGEKWIYHTPAYRMLIKLLEAATGEQISAYTARKLWTPLGMANSKWDSAPVGNGKPGVNYFWMRASLRDMARFGLFALHQGEWNGKQLVSAKYMKEATTQSQSLNEGYGYLWWVNSGNSYIAPVQKPNPRRFMPDCPRDTFAALGAMDKKIYVVPSLDLVVTRHGDTAGKESNGAMSSFDNEFLGRICRALKA